MYHPYNWPLHLTCYYAFRNEPQPAPQKSKPTRSGRLDSYVDGLKFKNIVLKGGLPKMAYREKLLDGLTSDIDSRFEDFDSNPVLKATQIALMTNWPDECDEGNLFIRL